MLWVGRSFIAFGALVSAHVALAAPGKIARTDTVFHQIEAQQ